MSFANQQQSNINNTFLTTFQTHHPSSHHHQQALTAQLQVPQTPSVNNSQNLLSAHQGLQQTQIHNSSINSAILPYSQQPSNLLMGQSSIQSQQLPQQSQIDKSQSNIYGQNSIPAYPQSQSGRNPYIMMIPQPNMAQNILAQQQQHNQQPLSASSQSSQNYSTNTNVGLSNSLNQQSQNAQHNLHSQSQQQQQTGINSNSSGTTNLNISSKIQQPPQQSSKGSSSLQPQSQSKNKINHNLVNGNTINGNNLNSVVENNKSSNQKNSSLSNSSHINNINQQGNLNGSNHGCSNTSTEKGQNCNGNGLVNHQMNEVNLCKQNLICFICDRNICEYCVDHNKGHITLSIDKIYEQSFSNVISTCQKPYLSCIDSMQKNEKSFQKFQDFTKDLIDGAFHNFKIAEAYSSRDFKTFGQIFRNHYQIGQNAEAIQVYQEKPESISNLKGTLEKQLDKAYERLINFISSINQITSDEISQNTENLISQSIPIQNVTGNSDLISQNNTFPINNLPNSQNSSHLPPNQLPQISQNLPQMQIHGQNYFNQIGGQQLYDQHMNFPQGVPNNQNPYMLLQSLPYNRQYSGQHSINMQNKHIGNLNNTQQIPNQQRPVHILQNGIGDSSNENKYGDSKNKQKNNQNNVIDLGPTKKHKPNKSQQATNSNTAPLNTSQGLNASHISQNNYSTNIKQQYQNASSSGIAQSQFSSEESFQSQNEGQGTGNLVCETNLSNNKQGKHFSSDNMKQEVIETHSKTSSHQNIQVPSNQQNHLNNQIDPTLLTNTAQRSNVNSSQNIPLPYNKQDQSQNPQDDDKHQNNAKLKQKKPHKPDAIKLKAYQEYTHEDRSTKFLSKKYDVVEGTIKTWIQQIKEKIENNEIEDNYVSQKKFDNADIPQNQHDKVDIQQLVPLSESDLKYMREKYGCSENQTQENQLFKDQQNEMLKQANKNKLEQEFQQKQYLKKEDNHDDLIDAESSHSVENNSKAKQVDDKSEIDIEYDEDDLMQEESKQESENHNNSSHQDSEDEQRVQKNQNEKSNSKLQKNKQINNKRIVDSDNMKQSQNNISQSLNDRDSNKQQNQKQLSMSLKNEHVESLQDLKLVSIDKNKEDNSQNRNQMQKLDLETNYKEQLFKNTSSPLNKKLKLFNQQQEQTEQNKSNQNLTPTRGVKKTLNLQKDEVIEKKQRKFDSENEDKSDSPHIFVEESFEKLQNSNPLSVKSSGQNKNSRKIFDSPQQMPLFKPEQQQMDNSNGELQLNDAQIQELKSQKYDDHFEMRLICFPLLDKYEDIPLEQTIFALSKDNIVQLKYALDNEETYKQICSEQFDGRIKELKFQILKQESIVFIHLEDGSLFMWRWQLKESCYLLQQNVQNFDTFDYQNNIFIVVQKGDMNLKVITLDQQIISNLDNIKPEEKSIPNNCSIQNFVAWGCEERQQWYIGCSSGNYFWAYQLDINENISQYLEKSQTLPPFKIKYETLSFYHQEIIKIRLHKNQKDQQEVIGASESGLLYIFDILKNQQVPFKPKNQGEKQMQDIQVFHPHNYKQMDDLIQDDPKIILCYENFIRVRKHKKLQFPQSMRCATHEVKQFEINVYYVLNNQDTIRKHSINLNP